MIYFLIFLYVIFLILIFLSRKEKLEKKHSFLDGMLEKMAKWLSKRPLLKNLRSLKVEENLNMLHPAKDIQGMVESFYTNKVKNLLVLLLAGTVVVTFLKVYSSMNPEILSDFSIKRNEKGQGEKVVEATAYLTNEEEVKREEITVVVSQQAYTAQEIDEFFTQIKESLEMDILLENDSGDHVVSALNLPLAYDDNPVQITWTSSDYGLIDEDGTVFNEELLEPVAVILTAELLFEEKKEEIEIPVVLYPKEYTKEERLQIGLKNAIEEENQISKGAPQITLPKKIEDYGVYYVEKSQGTEALLWIMFVVVSILLCINEDAKIQTQVEKKNKALILEYPEFVSKLALLTHAGTTIKGAIGKILSIYDEEKKTTEKINYCYEELRIALYEMENGVYEEKAYENLGKRIKLPSYVKLSALLSQNVKKGSKDLIRQLQKEADEAFEERKSMARRLGEEAGTKLLVPMVLMLLVVLVLIMVPAFLSYEF